MSLSDRIRHHLNPLNAMKYLLILGFSMATARTIMSIYEKAYRCIL